ncbi:MAG: Spi family protease inhibitor [Bacteroidota bacterium]
MKKIICFLLVLALGTNIANATSITLSIAREVAEKFYKQNSEQLLISTTLAHVEKSATGEILFYVFNVNQNNGYIVVTAEASTPLILDYSTDGQFEAPEHQSNVVIIEKWNSNNWTSYKKSV